MFTPPCRTVAQVAEHFAVSRETVYAWVRAGHLGCLRQAGGQIRIRRADVEDFERRHTVPAKEGPPAPAMSDAASSALPNTRSAAPAGVNSASGDPLPGWPRLLTREMAAAYLSVTPGEFDQGARNGVWPNPLTIGRRKLWDRAGLDRAVDVLAGAVDHADDERRRGARRAGRAR